VAVALSELAMSALPRQPDPSLLLTDWHADAAQLLDEHHLAAWSDDPVRRTQFAVAMGQFLGGLRDAEVCVLYGKYITDLESFCYQLERAIPGPMLNRRIDGPSGVVSLLRERATFRGRTVSKFRFYVWHDADVLLRADHKLFGRICDAMAGVAAEAEYVSDDVLLIHRLVCVGGPILDIYSQDKRGQLKSWYDDGKGDPFWQVVTGIDKPSFLSHSIEKLTGRR
jgi:hypothetical protein